MNNSFVTLKRHQRQVGSDGAGDEMQIAKAEPETKRLRKQAGTWLKELRARAGLSQIELAEILGFKYYTFISQLGADPRPFARELLSYYDPELYRLLFEVKR